jgi:carbohydrate diacid regulator
MQPAVYCFNEMLLEHLLLSVSPHYSLKYLEKKLADCQKESDTADLVETFSTYCECFFSKQKAAEKLHLHRNTLAYRLAKTEEKFNLSMDNFEEVIAFYLVILMKKLGSSGGTKG